MGDENNGSLKNNSSSEPLRRGKKRKEPEGESSDVTKRMQKKEQKRARFEQKLKRPNAQLCYDAKLIWEEIRQKKDKIEPEKRKEMIDKLIDELKGKMLEIVMKRDISRVIQSILKYGTPEQREVVFEELKGNVLDMAKNNYAHFILIKMLLYGTKEQRNYIIKQFYGKVRTLVKHREASNVLEYAYTQYCNSTQRHTILEEFYGKQFALFKTNEKRTFESIVAADPTVKPFILNHMRQYLIQCYNKQDIIGFSILHRPMLEYITYTDYAGKSEMIEFLRESIVNILHTKDGAHVGVLCVAYGKSKDRKFIVKSFKGYGTKIAKEEYGHQVLLASSVYVDDTVLFGKTVLKELVKDGIDVITDKHGHLIIMFLFTGLSSKYFPPSVIQLLVPVNVPNPEKPEELIPSSKKDVQVKQQELLKTVESDIIDILVQNSYPVSTSFYGREIFKEAYLHSNDENKKKLRDSILMWVNFDPNTVKSEKAKMEKKYHPLEEKPVVNQDIMDDVNASKILKQLSRNDDEFASQLYDKIKPKIVEYATSTNGSWVVTGLLGNQKISNSVKEQLKKSMKELNNSTSKHKGTSVIVSILEGKQQAKQPKSKKEKK
eukprot:TRINITY_DN11986_c0_g1_i1.p1 TRINITY_DN11986_c0_g1~~TRINITY_DN11986_c0_g1_i1.p1  ORF type:complete len:649 (-),score=194.09 TRINITY_DN11986_c0_g1_i1:182-1993(-)